MADEQKILKKSRNASRLSTVVSIALVVFLLGTLGVLLLHARKLSDYVRENIELTVVLKPDADSLVVNELYQRIHSTPSVKEARIISKSEAAETLKKELGEDFISFLGFNPLYPSIEVRFRADFADQPTISSFIGSFKTNSVVHEIQYQPSLVDSINKNVKAISLIILSFSLLLLLVSIALINNTIHISLYARRLLIKSMLLVGANKAFIRKPFLILSFWNGLLGSLIAICLLATAIYFSASRVPELTLIKDYKLMAYTGAMMLVWGTLLSLICTIFAVNKYLRYRTGELN